MEYKVSSVYQQLLTTYYLLLTIYYLLLTTYYSLLTTHYSLLQFVVVRIENIVLGSRFLAEIVE